MDVRILAAAAACALWAGAAGPIDRPARGAVPCRPREPHARLQDRQPGQACLDPARHGPFEKLARREPWYSADGRRINPHMYVPHDMRAEINIPRCTSCHEAHALPRPAAAARKAGIETCYQECHHARNLKPCKDCHKR